MAGRGPTPKDPDKRRRRNGPPVPTTELAADHEVRGPALPDGIDWPTQTLAWWETWRSSPQAQTFTDTDWSFLLDSALLHSRLWSGEMSVAAELRLRVAKFGATPEDRARLRMTITEPDPASEQSRGGAPRKSRYEHLRPA